MSVVDVIDKVNAGLVAAGHAPIPDLPKGRRSSSTSCPLANAFKPLSSDVAVGSDIRNVPRHKAFKVAAALGTKVTSSNGKADVRLPAELSNFVTEFDGGRHPQYDDTSV